MTEKGYITLSRKFFENTLWKEPRKYSRAEAWLDLIQMARFDSSVEIHSNRAIEVLKGDIVASRRFLECRWQWGSTKVSNFLDFLKKNGMIAVKQTSGQTVITLCKYDTYNRGRTNEQTTDKPPTNHRQTTDKPNINNINNSSNSNNNFIGGTPDVEISKNPPKPENPKEKSCAKKEKFDFLSELIGIGVEEQVAIDWLEVRKLKKASNTQTAFNKIKSEIEIAIIDGYTANDCIVQAVSKDWRGFEFKWLESIKNNYNGTTTIDRKFTGQSRPQGGATPDGIANAIQQGIGRAMYNRQQRAKNSQDE